MYIRMYIPSGLSKEWCMGHEKSKVLQRCEDQQVGSGCLQHGQSIRARNPVLDANY